MSETTHYPDRGDGRSRPHALRLEVAALAVVVVRRDGDQYIARVARVGNCYPPAPGFVECGATPGEAIRLALAAAGLVEP